MSDNNNNNGKVDDKKPVEPLAQIILTFDKDLSRMQKTLYFAQRAHVHLFCEEKLFDDDIVTYKN